MHRLRFYRKAKLKRPNQVSSRNGSTFSDILWTSLCALKDSADAFPPLKSAVGGVVALWEIAERAKHSKADARDIALRTQEIIDVIADAVPDGSKIPLAMLQSIERFTLMLEEIRVSMEVITLTGGVSRVVHLSENERTVQDIKVRLDEQYRDFLAASALRVEVQQTAIAQPPNPDAGRRGKDFCDSAAGRSAADGDRSEPNPDASRHGKGFYGSGPTAVVFSIQRFFGVPLTC
ncbi:hypothetical protein C8J57DRAFT_426932 [Mycena rebaudengoi]|nr:hypothetical protein C8J57DRAFT_426932 [Mycena rebaudengoi]